MGWRSLRLGEDLHRRPDARPRLLDVAELVERHLHRGEGRGEVVHHVAAHVADAHRLIGDGSEATRDYDVELADAGAEVAALHGLGEPRDAQGVGEALLVWEARQPHAL